MSRNYSFFTLQLSVEQLENLAEAVLDFTSTAELTAWLQAQTQV